VVAIVTALELETPVYREVYREQLACTVPAATSLVAAALQSSRATTTCRHQKCIPFGHVYQTSIKPSVYNIVLTSTLNLRVHEQMLNRVNFAQWSTPQQATFRTEVLWPLPPLSTIDPRSEPEGALPPVETDDSLNAGWDGPPSWNVSAAAMTGDIVL
jgi:hypothetical protein